MDIRNFFSSAQGRKNQKRKQADKSSGDSDSGGEDSKQKNVATASDGVASTSSTVPPAPVPVLLPSSSDTQDKIYCSNDVGQWLGRSYNMTSSQKLEILKNCWIPPPSYDFAKDAVQLKRKFKHSWLAQYAPWLAYSQTLKGALCIYCVLFPPTLTNMQGSFMVRPFTRYKDMHEFAKTHASSQCHKSSATAAKCFVENMPVDVQLISAHQKEIDANKKVLASIISTVIFCGTHDLPLRGKGQHEGVFEDLIKLKIESGDQIMKEHIESGAKNATYTSPRIQNEIIDLCGDVIRDDIIAEVKKAHAYSILADESCDVSGKEQLSIGVRFFDEEKMVVCEEFLGFVELSAMDAKSIASNIDNFFVNTGLYPEKCVGQGYDGCSTMSGKDGGVQKILREKYQKALFFHCASHKLNLVVHDLNQIAVIRNTVTTIKEIIKFFRESGLRRKCVPNIPMFCETRWSQKYKSIAIFKEHYVQVVKALSTLSTDGNNATRKSAFQLHCAATNSEFIVSVCLIAKYSAQLQPIVNALQSKSIDLLQCANHIKRITDTLRKHRETADVQSESLIAEAESIADDLETDLRMPRITNRQTHRANPPAQTPSEFWKRSLMIPYLDSLILSLEQRFSEDNLPAYSLLTLHPHIMLQMSYQDFIKKTEPFCSYYNLSGFLSEAELWYNMWEQKNMAQSELKEMELVALVKETQLFYPAIKQALHISLAQPCTTCTIERSFSTLRRVKTWLRSTMTENRLVGLCMMSAHRKRVLEAQNKFEIEILNRFCQNPRRLLLK
ncbi:52 kDa repressor of the inhibitor of the protein kinase-like [Maniola hyperantus]|uniref:52 kDa repressor of the inhibitor of the protein kinase-like n=1 Tax=Aphantopus hyperantus TaxID=2795564 RepID=UPI0037499393